MNAANSGSQAFVDDLGQGVATQGIDRALETNPSFGGTV
jgi:hypothetical protein